MIGANSYLGSKGRHLLIIPSTNQFEAKSILEIVYDIALAHSGADGHWCMAVTVMLFVKFIHSSMNHSYLGGVAVDQGGLPAFLDKVCNDFSGLFDSGLLLWKIGSKVFVTACYYKSLFCHNVTSFLDAQSTVYYNGREAQKKGIC